MRKFDEFTETQFAIANDEYESRKAKGEKSRVTVAMIEKKYKFKKGQLKEWRSRKHLTRKYKNDKQ